MNRLNDGHRRTAFALAMFAALPLAFAAHAVEASWSQPVAPFRIVGDVYYVGTKGLSAYLIATPAGEILIDGTATGNAPLIERNIARLGFRLRDVKLLLNSHAHFDHAGALAQLQHDTGAPLLASPGDREALETGHPGGESLGGWTDFPPAKVQRGLRDGETLRVGGVALTAWITPGHTPGCTTWSLPVRDHGRRLQVVIPCSIAVADNVLVANRAYPNIVADYRRSFARLKAMKADVVLTNHPEVADVLGREARRRAGQADAFVDRGQFQRIVAQSETAFDAELAKQEATPPAASGGR
jgi:metallo-beta-lactamase class B